MRRHQGNVGIREKPQSDFPTIQETHGYRLLVGLRTPVFTENATIAPWAFWLPSLGALALALGVRLFVLFRATGMVDGDESVLGVQAERILQGAHPIYFYGQAYMGSWDAYLLAPLIARFGPSGWAIHTITLVESLILVPLTGALALRLYGRRSLIPTLLLTAAPPLYIVVTQLRMLGGYVETLDLGVTLMLLATVIAQRWEARRPTTWLWAIAGFLVGFGLWVDPLTVSYVVACALWLAPLALAHTVIRVAAPAPDDTQAHARSHGFPANGASGAERAVTPARTVWRWRPILLCVSLFGLCLAVGAAPAIDYALTQQFANLNALSHPYAPPSLFRLGTLSVLLRQAMPTVVGELLPYPSLNAQATLLCHATQGVATGIAAVALIHTVRRVLPPKLDGRVAITSHRTSLSPLAASTSQRWNDAFPLILLVVMGLLFWRSSATDVPQPYPVDFARYALPLTTALTLMCARLFGDLSALPLVRRPAQHHDAAVPTAQRTSAWSGVVMVAFALLMYLTPYALTNLVSAMQSPYNPGGLFPTQNTAMITYLEVHHIRDVWVNHWTGNVIVYLSDQQVSCADYVDAVGLNGQRRFPELYAHVSAASKASFIVTSKPADGEPLTARALDALGVTYISARFGNYVVITPVSRTVQPHEIASALVGNYLLTS